MRLLLYAASGIALAMLATPDSLRSVAATAASALFESTPFLLAGIVAAYLARRRSGWIAYLGCGCEPGPSARSLPAAAATYLAFGPWVALARLIAAILAAQLLRRRARFDAHACELPNLLGQLAAVLPAALVASAMTQIVSSIGFSRAHPIADAVAGALIGFGTAPCGLGAVAVAGSLHAQAPTAAAAYLCVAGIVDLRSLSRTRSIREGSHDALAYALLAIALGIVAWRHGDALVHPVLTVPLAIGAFAVVACAARHRKRLSPRVRIAPSLMLLGALVTTPAPSYHASETTLTNLFPGERLNFTGRVSSNGRSTALVRYAITCCRADAVPVVVRLTGPLPALADQSWARVEGNVESATGDLRLHPNRVTPIAPPTDPFIYR